MPTPSQIITEDITSRFIEAYENLKELKKVKNKADFARSIGYPPPTVNNILNKKLTNKGKSRRYVTIDMIYCLCINSSFQISADWIITGREPMFTNPKQQNILSISDIVNKVLKEKGLV
jgi:hypothetical protein